MAGPRQPVIHDAPHDLESLFYILVGICVLLDTPFKFKSNDKLSCCFNKYFNTFEPSVLKSIIIQSDFTWFLMIVDHISPYFKPLLLLLTHLCQDIVSTLLKTKSSTMQSPSHTMFLLAPSLMHSSISMMVHGHLITIRTVEGSIVLIILELKLMRSQDTGMTRAQKRVEASM